MEFPLTMNPAPSAEVTVTVTVTQSGTFIAEGITRGTRPVIFPSGSATVTLEVPTVGDEVDEPDGSVTVNIEEGTGYTLGFPASATVNVNDDDVIKKKKPTTTTGGATTGGEGTTTTTDDDTPLPEVQVSFGAAQYEVFEGDSVEITVKLDKAPRRTVSVPLTVTPRGRCQRRRLRRSTQQGALFVQPEAEDVHHHRHCR